MEKLRTKYPVSHEWERAQHLQEFRNGSLSREEVCDADFLLRAAGKYHGQPAARPCPICGEDMKVTLWIYGEILGRRSGSARTPSEIREIAAEMTVRSEEFTVHKVEVCLHCRWNHLLKTATVY